eukprot:7873-Heterococcus_DN1.PRE.1
MPSLWSSSVVHHIAQEHNTCLMLPPWWPAPALLSHSPSCCASCHTAPPKPLALLVAETLATSSAQSVP